MAIATGTAIALAAASSAAGGLYSASQSSRAAKRGAQVAQTAGDQNIAEQRRQYDQTRADQMPFMQSDLARRAMADRSYGIQNMRGTVDGPGMNEGQFANDPRIGQPDFGSYVRNNLDLMADFNASGGRFGGLEDYGARHYQMHGQGEGRQLGTFQAPQMQPQMAAMQQSQASEQPFDPLADFNRSADRALLNYEPAINSVNAAFSAKGQGLDSSASNAMGRSLTGLTQNAFYNFRSGLEGSLTGAVNTVGQAGQNMASNNANQRNNVSNALASSYTQRADARSAGAGALVGSANWFANQSGMFNQPRRGTYGPMM